MPKKIMLWSLLVITALAVFGHITQAMMAQDGRIEGTEQIEQTEESEQIEEEEILPFPVLHITSELDPFIQYRRFWHDGTLSLSGSNVEYGDFTDVAVGLRGEGTPLGGMGKINAPCVSALRRHRAS